MKQVSDFIKKLRILRVELLMDTTNGTTCIYRRSVYMPLSATGVMSSERERASMYLPCGFRLRTSVSVLDDGDVRTFVRSLTSYVCECTSDFRFFFKEVQRTAVHYIDI